MTNNMPFPPRARKSAGVVKEGHQHLQQTSEIIHQHRLSLASQIRKFDARWASLFNLAPVLNKLTKGRQMPTEFRDNAQVLLDDVQHALHDAHTRKLPKIPEEGDSIIPGPPPVPISTGRPRSLASWRRRQGVDSQAPSEKQSIVVRVRSKLRRKRAVKRKGSKKGPLSRFNPFRYMSTTMPHPQEASITMGEPLPPTIPTVRHISSRRTMRSGGSSKSSRKKKKKKSSKSSKSSSGSRLRDVHSQIHAPPTMPPLVDPDWKPHLPPPPNFSPMKLDMSSIGHYSPTITRPLLYQPPPWPGVGIVDPNGPMGSVTPSSPQPYYLEVGDRRERAEGKDKRDKRDKRKSKSKTSSRDDSPRERERKEEEDDRHGSRRRHTHKHHHRSHRSRDADSSEDSRRDRDRDRKHRHRSSREDYSDSKRREKERERERERERDTSEARRRSTRRHYDDPSRREHSSKGSSTPTSPSFTHTTHHHQGYSQPSLPQIVERSRFQENFSVIS